MHRIVRLAVSVALLVASLPSPIEAAPLPKHIGQCSITGISNIGTRLFDPAHPHIRPNPELGTSVDFVNGGHQVSYDLVKAIARSRIGDRVRVCLVSIPRHCPPGDTRGRFYRTLNLRTHRGWTLPDAQHLCGGA